MTSAAAELALHRRVVAETFAKARAEGREPDPREADRAFAGVMTKFKIHELSAVDQPAQVSAYPAFVKRADASQEVDFSVRKAATRDAVTALAKARARADGVSFERAYDAVVIEMAPALGPNLI